MADINGFSKADLTGLSSYSNIQANHEKYADLFDKSKSPDMVSTDTFFSLLMAEMTNQDPLEPTSNTEFVSQMAQFTALQAQQDTLKYSMSNYASNLVGKTVTVNDSAVDGGLITGVCSGVTIKGTEVLVTVNGEQYQLSAIKGVTDTPEKIEESDVSKASSFIGKEVTVKLEDENGEELYDKGTVDAVEVKDGKPMIAIGNYVYGLDQIVLVEPGSNKSAGMAIEPASGAEE